MSRDTCLVVLAAAGAIALGTARCGPSGALPRNEPASRTAALAAAIAEVEAGRRTTPIVAAPEAGGEAVVTFLARSAGGRAPRIVSDVSGWGEHLDGTFDFSAGTMTRVGKTEWYSLRANVVPRARIEYLIAYAPTDYRIDPHNPRQTAGRQFGGLQASEFVTPGYAAPPEFAGSPVPPAGTTREAAIDSRTLGAPCRVIVYTPVGYRRNATSPVAVFLDLRSGQVARVIDWLVARRAIEPIVAVFVGPLVPGGDHFAGAPLRGFLDDELPAWLASRYGVTRDADRRAVIGISYGARDALDAALDCGLPANGPGARGCRRGAFGRLGLLVPGRRINAADLGAMGDPRNHRLRVAILAGRYDRANQPTAAGVRQALAGAGHRVDYIEVPEGHSAMTWTHHLGEVLASLFGLLRHLDNVPLLAR